MGSYDHEELGEDGDSDGDENHGHRRGVEELRVSRYVDDEFISSGALPLPSDLLGFGDLLPQRLSR